MIDSPERRRSKLRPLAQLGVPEGAPGRLFQAARRARVAAALGPELGRYLLGVIEREHIVTLRFAGSAWSHALAHEEDALRRRLAEALGYAPLEVRIASDAAAEPSAPAPAVRRTPAPPRDPGEARERLRRVADRLLARRAENGEGTEEPR